MIGPVGMCLHQQQQQQLKLLQGYRRDPPALVHCPRVAARFLPVRCRLA